MSLGKETIMTDKKVAVLGGGDSKRYIELAEKLGVASLLSFDGVLPAGEPVRSWLLDCDYYIQPSRQEGLPRGLLEAMSTGLPAVGSSVGAIPNLLKSDYIHRKGDFLDLTNKIINMLDADYEELSKESLSIAETYRFDLVNSRRKKFYEKIFVGGLR